MKKLLLIRHAKSSWTNAFQGDFERPLNDRGHRDAPAMAEKLCKRGITIDCFVSSTANRARTTAEYFANAYGKSKKDIVFFPELYHAPEAVFLNVIKQLPNTCNNIAIFSHNPGITHFVNSLTNNRLDNMPTCGIFAITVNTTDWALFEQAAKAFWFFDFPKNGL